MVRAAERFFEETGLSGGVSMTLAKRIPSEAGMGGGSSDAAAVLRGLARLYETDLSLATLARWGHRSARISPSAWWREPRAVRASARS